MVRVNNISTYLTIKRVYTHKIPHPSNVNPFPVTQSYTYYNVTISQVDFCGNERFSTDSCAA